MQNSDPWYTRSEFWMMLASVIGGITGVNVATNPIVQNVSMGLSAVAPLLYMFGRNNVKVAQAAAAAAAAGQGLRAAPPAP